MNKSRLAAKTQTNPPLLYSSPPTPDAIGLLKNIKFKKIKN